MYLKKLNSFRKLNIFHSHDIFSLISLLLKIIIKNIYTAYFVKTLNINKARYIFLVYFKLIETVIWFIGRLLTI